MNSPTLTGTRILANCDHWREDAYSTDLDWTELMRHFNGGALIQDTDDTGRDRVRRPNLLFGNKFLSGPARQLSSPYYQPLGMVEFKVKRGADPARRLFVEEVLNREANKVIRKSERLKWPYRACVGDSVIWGIGALYRDDPYDWCPKYGRPIYPWDAPADITDDKFSDWAFTGRLTAREIMSRLKRREKGDDKEGSGWNQPTLRGVLQSIIERHAEDAGFEGNYPSFEWDDPIEIQQFVEAQTWGDQTMDNALPVYWYFSKDFSSERAGERPVDLYCVSRYGENVIPSRNGSDPVLKINRDKKDGDKEDSTRLFYQKALFSDIRECFFPFVVDTMEGGEPKMRRVLGLGQLNYDLDIRMQTTVNAGLEGAEFDFAPFFSAGDEVSDDIMEQITAEGLNPYDFIPLGVKMMEKPRGARPYSALMEFTNLFHNSMGQNTAQEYGSANQATRGRQELEVQVLERQAQNTETTTRRMDEWIDRGNCMCKVIGETICSPKIMEWDVAFPEQMALADTMLEYGISPEEYLGNVECSMRQPPGAGDPGVALRRAKMTFDASAHLGPAARKIALREFMRVLWGGDARMADLLVPDNEANPDQVAEAQQQNAVAFTQLTPPVVRDSDMPGVHVPVHIKALQSVAMLAAQSGEIWRARDAQGFQALAGHTMADVNQLGSVDPDGAKRAARHLGQLSKMVAKFQVAEQPMQPQIDPAKRADLALREREQDRKEARDQTDMFKWIRTQMNREKTSERQQQLQLADQDRNERNDEVNRAATATNAAVQVASLQNGKKDSDSE